MALLTSGLRPLSVSCFGSGGMIVPARTHLGYIPRQGKAKQYDSEWDRTKLALIKINLRPVKRIHFKVDPFHPDAASIRKVMYHLSSERIVKTNQKCYIKTEIICDRSEPTMKVDMADEDTSLFFKTANLTSGDIITMFNDFVLPRVKEEKEVVTESKGAKGAGKGKGKGKGKK